MIAMLSAENFAELNKPSKIIRQKIRRDEIIEANFNCFLQTTCFAMLHNFYCNFPGNMFIY